MARKGMTARPNEGKTLVSALAEKGTPGIILLGIIFLAIWAPVPVIGVKLFSYLGTAERLSEMSWTGPIVVLAILGALGVGYVFAAYRLTSKIMSAMIPTIMAEAKAMVLMSEAFGGRIMTSSGLKETLAVDRRGAETRVKQIMAALLQRARRELRSETVRLNIFTLNEDGVLRILKGFHVNMEEPMIGENELTISIPNGFLSSGRAYKYFRPMLSRKGADERWPYSDERQQLAHEVQKAHPDLAWIISMPIPYQVEPFRLVSGVLNVDGLGSVPNVDQMRTMLTDISAAACLIAVLNRSTGFLEGVYSVPSEPPSTEQEQLKGYLISPEDFAPASCPEPTSEFVQALANIKGLEFFARISPTEVAGFLRDQVRS